MEIYAEYFFIENFMADAAIAALTLKIWRKSISLGRFIFAVLLMTLYSFCIFVPYSAVFFSCPLKIGFSVIIVKLLFLESGIKELIQATLTFFGVGIAMGGAVSFAIYFMKIGGMSASGIVYVYPGSYPVILLCIGASCGFIHLFLKLISEKKKREAVMVEVRLQMGEKSSEFKALVDTGNCLKDPIDGLPVMLGEAAAVRSLIMDNYHNAKIRIIPYSAVGVESGTLVGVKIDNMYISRNSESYKAGPAVLAIYNGSFDLGDGCNIILHPDMLKKEVV